MGFFDIIKKKEQLFEKDLKRWGELKDENEFYIKQCNLSRYSPRTFLNIFFKPVDASKYKAVEKVFRKS